MYYVYILYSESILKYYVGHTENLDIRIAQHNSGRGNFTSKGLPWRLVKYIEFDNKSEAVKLELKIKKRGISRFLEDQGN